jgi:hypothetical protein
LFRFVFICSLLLYRNKHVYIELAFCSLTELIYSLDSFLVSLLGFSVYKNL